MKWGDLVGYRNLGWFHDTNFGARLNLLSIPHLAFESKREIIAVVPCYPLLCSNYVECMGLTEEDLPDGMGDDIHFL